MSDEMAWLIERADPNNPGCVLPDSFLGIQGSYDGVYGGGRFTWLPNASDAIRFARHKDAAMFARLGITPMAIAQTQAEVAAERMPKGCVKLEQVG